MAPLKYFRSRVKVSVTTSTTSKVHGEGKKSDEVKTPATLTLYFKATGVGLWASSGSFNTFLLSVSLYSTDRRGRQVACK